MINAYLLPLSALLLLGGALGDRFGRRLLLIAGIGLFALASLACALAPSLPWLLVGRAVQGVGAALLMPNSLAILGADFAGEARAGRSGSGRRSARRAARRAAAGRLADRHGRLARDLPDQPADRARGAIVLAWRFVRDADDRRRAAARPCRRGCWPPRASAR